MTRSFVRPLDVFFHDASHSLCASPYAMPLRSVQDIAAVCRGREVLFLAGDALVAKRLLPAFAAGAGDVRVVEMHSGQPDDFERSLSQAPTGNPLLVLAFRDYQQALTNLCNVTPGVVPVVLPSGFLALAAPKARYMVQNGACVSYGDVRHMLDAFKGSRLLLWNRGNMARYALLPALMERGMLQDVVGIVDDAPHDIAFDGVELRSRAAGDWIAQEKIDAVLVADGAARDAFGCIHSFVRDFTPILLHAQRMGILDSFQSIVAAHSLFAGAGGLLRAGQAEFTPPAPLCKERYAVLYGGHPQFGDAHYAGITTWSQASLLGSGFAPADIESPFVNCSGGNRHTAFQPEEWDSSIYLFGASSAFGAFVEDESTVASLVQKHCHMALADARMRTRFRVVNYGTNASDPANCFRKMFHLPLRPGDHVLFLAIPYWPRSEPDSFLGIVSAMHQHCLKAGASFSLFLCPELMFAAAPSPDEQEMIRKFRLLIGEVVTDEAYPVWNPARHERALQALRDSGVFVHALQPYFERPHEHGELFVDIGHVCCRGMQIIADAIFEQAIARRSRRHAARVYEQGLRDYGRIVRSVMLSNESFVSFLETVPRFESRAGTAIGAVVMNCNPFTLGHEHLVRSALEQVDYLYAFILEEDKSFFSTAQRMEMVLSGMRKFGDRVRVVPGGPGIISSITFAEYFTKEERQQGRFDAGVDALVFASIVCPEFGIGIRFFGDEPHCAVTNGYMRQLMDILPLYGVACKVIPRIETQGRPISASRVRALYRESDWRSMAGLVPESTLEHLLGYCGCAASAGPHGACA